MPEDMTINRLITDCEDAEEGKVQINRGFGLQIFDLEFGLRKVASNMPTFKFLLVVTYSHSS